MDGVTATTAELNILDGVTATTAELNILDGVTATTAELNILDGVTSTATELNLLDGSSANSIVNSKAVIYGSSGECSSKNFIVKDLGMNDPGIIDIHYMYLYAEYNGYRLHSTYNDDSNNRIYGSFRIQRSNPTNQSSYNTLMYIDGMDTTYFYTNVEIGSGKSLSLVSDSAYKPGGGSWSSPSDSRIKENISTISSASALSVINKLSVKTFTYIENYRTKYNLADVPTIGLLADDVENITELETCVTIKGDEVFSEECESGPDGLPCTITTSSITNLKNLNIDKINYYLMAAVQELSTLVTQLQTDNTALTARVTALESA